MNTFAASALKTATSQSNSTVTTNGAKAFKSTRNANLDLFGKSGEIKYPNFLADFQKALAEDEDIAIRNLLHTRDVRSGKGVRNTFQSGLVWLAINKPSLILQSNILNKVTELGYWKDLFVLVEEATVGLSIKQRVILTIARGLEDENTQGLVAKWLPLKGPVASMLRSYLKLTPKQLRQKIVPLRSQVTERFMCEQRWSEITYQHVPSRCMHLNHKAFRSHDTDRFNKFMEKAAAGEVKVNSGTLYPHEITEAYSGATECDRYGYGYRKPTIEVNTVAEAQWKNLPNWLEGKTNAILPVVDLSGSMNTSAGKWSYSHIAITLAAYISERTEGPFKDLVTTFADEPAFVNLQSANTLLDRLVQINAGRVGYSTNIEGTFNLILNHAIQNRVPQSDMPEALLFLSDTQSNFTSRHRTVYQACREKFIAAGYEPPKLLFWVLNATGITNVPVEFDSSGAALVSGFSPSVMKGLLTDLDQYTPENVMLATLNDSRYSLTYY